MHTGKVKSFMQKANGIDFYCEVRGKGPTVALIPSGEGDCGSFIKIADKLAEEFTVFSLDMRGCSRSGMPSGPTKIYPKDLATDVAELIKILDLGPASFFGSSSGGQAVLSIGLYYPEIARNIMVHEAAVPKEMPDAGLGKMVEHLIEATGSKNAAFSAVLTHLVGDEDAWKSLGSEFHNRINKNGDNWVDYYLGSIDQKTYSGEELSKMPPLVFSVGMHTPAWLVEANRRTANRVKAELVWLPCMHFPHVTIPELLTEHIRKNVRKNL